MTLVAVVGCGQWGNNLLRNFSQLGLLGAVCDEDNEKALEASQRYGVPVLPWGQLLDCNYIKGLAIATSAPTHVPLALEAMKHKKHVFVEKPAALCTKDMEQLCEASEEFKVILMVGHLLRYHPAFLAVQDRLSDVGEIRLIDAYRHSFGRLCPWEKNVFWSLAPHDISMVLALVQEYPSTVSVKAESLYTSADQGIAHLKFDRGITVRLSTSWIAPFKEQRLIITGTQGTLVFDDTASQKLTFYPHVLAEDKLIKRGEPYSLSYTSDEPLMVECKHFGESIACQSQPRTHGQEALQVTRILEAIDQNLGLI